MHLCTSQNLQQGPMHSMRLFLRRSVWDPLHGAVESLFALYVKGNFPVAIKPDQTFIRNGIVSIFAELTATNGIIVVCLIYKRSVDISTDNSSVALEPLIFSLYPHVKIYIMGDLNIYLLDHNLSPPVENFINQMISKNFLPIINRHTRTTP